MVGKAPVGDHFRRYRRLCNKFCLSLGSLGIYATQEIGRHKQRGMGREEKRRAVFKVYDVNITFFIVYSNLFIL